MKKQPLNAKLAHAKFLQSPIQNRYKQNYFPCTHLPEDLRNQCPFLLFFTKALENLVATSFEVPPVFDAMV